VWVGVGVWGGVRMYRFVVVGRDVLVCGYGCVWVGVKLKEFDLPPSCLKLHPP